MLPDDSTWYKLARDLRTVAALLITALVAGAAGYTCAQP